MATKNLAIYQSSNLTGSYSGINITGNKVVNIYYGNSEQGPSRKRPRIQAFVDSDIDDEMWLIVDGHDYYHAIHI